MKAVYTGIDEIDDNHPFSYARLSTMKWDDISSRAVYQNYEAYVEADADRDFITLEKSGQNSEKKEILSSTISKGWKVHISIFDPHNDDTNLAKAWQVVYRTVIEYEIKKVKIVKNDAREFMRTDGDKAGKEITWYFFKDKLENEQVNVFLNDLTQRFISNGIIPGPVAKHDQGVINGSNYFSFRNDKKMYSAENPFVSISIEVADQPVRSIHPEMQSSKNPRKESSEDIPKRLSMEDSATNYEQEYNHSTDSDESSCCSRSCRK